jgi:hypothetical protein
MAVCSYCRATVLRDGATTANIGKLSEILEDFSPIQLGTAGVWKGKNFTVIGRLRLKYADGAWNEWNIEFKDGTLAWLSDASGQFVVTQLNASVKPPVGIDQLPVGRNINVNQQKYAVTDARTCVCIGGEGELPASANDGKEFTSVDLRSVGGNGFITFDYSDVPPSVYVGEACSRDELGLSNLRPDEEIERATGKLKGAVTGFDCPSCGASLEYHAGFGESIACPFCRAVVALVGDRRTVIVKQEELDSREPTISLGSKGVIRGKEYQVIGFMARSDGESSEWEEYILFSKDGGFLWLTHSDGEWYLGEVLNSLPADRGDQVYHGGKLFRQKSQYTAKTTFVLGEFNWRVKIGDEVQVTEWVSGEANLSRETYLNEVTWTLSYKFPAAALAKAFALPLAEEPKKTVQSGGIPSSWIIVACVTVFLVNVGAQLMGRGNDGALILAMIALWIPKYISEKFE